MSVSVEWHAHQQAVLYLRYEAGWTWEDHYEAVYDTRLMIEQQRMNRIDIILHVAGHAADGGIAASLVNERDSLLRGGIRLGLIVVVSETAAVARAVQRMGAHSSTKINRHYELCDTLEAAEALIAGQRDKVFAITTGFNNAATVIGEELIYAAV
jgi:hypothetical protein